MDKILKRSRTISTITIDIKILTLKKTSLNTKSTEHYPGKSLKTAKKQSWLRYVSFRISSTPKAEVWKKIRSIKGNKTYYTLTAIKEEDTPTTDVVNISEILVSTFRRTSINNNHFKEFQKYKLETKDKPPLFPNTDNDSQSIESLNESISSQKLMYALSKCGNTSPVLDSIPKLLLIKLPRNTNT